jgi:UPF0271 protein
VGTSIDLNCDMGEGFGAYRMGPDRALLDHVTSASIACGFHAGDPRVMDATVRAAVETGVAVGAHVAYPDLVGFGRRHLQVTGEELVTDVLFQIGALEAFCRRHGTAVRFVKAHGALYNDLAGDETLAGAFGDALLAYGGDLPALVLAGSPAVAVLRAQGVRVVGEGFADRGYTPDGRLAGRGLPGAVITEPAVVAERARRIAGGQPVAATDGSLRLIEADSICIHGDTPGAVELAGAVRRALAAHDISVQSFAARTG